MKRELTTTIISFTDGSYVKWKYIGKQERLYRPGKRYAIEVRVETAPNSIDHFFESWDKPSEARAVYFINRAIKEAKEH